MATGAESVGRVAISMSDEIWIGEREIEEREKRSANFARVGFEIHLTSSRQMFPLSFFLKKEFESIKYVDEVWACQVQMSSAAQVQIQMVSSNI